MPTPPPNAGIRDNHYCGNTALYETLLKRAVESIVSTFCKRVAIGLQTGRSFKIPDQKDQASDATDFELVTWLVIKKP
jgi:hypothetical protein